MSDLHDQALLRVMELLLSDNNSPNKVKKVFDELNKLPIETMLQVLNNAGFEVKPAQQIRQEIIRPLYETIIARFSSNGGVSKKRESSTEPAILSVQDYYQEAQQLGQQVKKRFSTKVDNRKQVALDFRVTIKKLRAKATAFRFSSTGSKVDDYLDNLDRQLAKICENEKRAESI